MSRVIIVLVAVMLWCLLMTVLFPPPINLLLSFVGGIIGGFNL